MILIKRVMVIGPNQDSKAQTIHEQNRSVLPLELGFPSPQHSSQMDMLTGLPVIHLQPPVLT